MSSDVKENAKRAMKELLGGLTVNAEEPMETAFAEPETVAEPVVFQASPKVEVTKIGGDTVITGSVKSSGALEIRGTVYGDIISDDDVYLYGRVAGNITCRNYFHYDGAVKGNITASNDIEVENAAAILGDLKAVTIRSDGRISGNIVSANKVELLENAIIVGDINTKYFTMKDSACLRGLVHLESSKKNVDNAFADCFNF